MITAIKDFKTKKAYAKLVEDKIIEYFRQVIFQPLFDIIDEPVKATNALDDFEVINRALKAGVIYYDNTGFIAKRKFPNNIARILEKWGAKYNKFKKMYVIDNFKIPEIIKVAIADNKIQMQMKMKAIDDVLTTVQDNIDLFVDEMIFDDEVKTILDDAGQQVKKNVKSIAVIEPELTPNQIKEIQKSYTENMRYYIKDFEKSKIPEMRKRVQELALKGERPDKIAQMLQTEYGVCQRKAKFLAFNETNIMLAEYKKVTYKEMGFTKFKWSTVLDGKERPEHQKLNGKIFYYDFPPIINEATGQRGLPGETYNCRCEAIPIRDDRKREW